MLRFSILVGLAAGLYAQDVGELFRKPPVDVDRALRARITEFYQMHVKAEFRQAEALVAEDTKDFFYNTNKPHYLSFEIQKIKYNEDFTKAEAVILCEQFINSPGFSGKPWKVPTPSDWKLENGKWCWYVDQEKLRNSPFGVMTPGPSVAGAKTDKPPQLPETAADFWAQLKPDKRSVELKPGSVEHVTITNGTSGPVTLEVESEVPGLRGWLDHTVVKPGEKVVLAITALDNATSGTVDLHIKPFGPVISIEVKVK